MNRQPKVAAPSDLDTYSAEGSGGSWSLRREEFAHGVELNGIVRTEWGIVDVYSIRHINPHSGDIIEATTLEVIMNGIIYRWRIGNFYSKRYLVTLSKRLAAYCWEQTATNLQLH